MILTSFYLAIMNRIINTTGAVHFDLFNQQYVQEDDANEEVFPRPAVFLEYDPQEWVSTGRKKQAAVALFRLHIVSDDVIQETTSSEPEPIRNAGLEHLKLIDTINKFMTGFSGEGFGSIAKVGVEFDHNHGGMHVTLVTFKTRLTDTSAMINYIKKQPAQKIIPNMLPDAP